jgi:aconitase B
VSVEQREVAQFNEFVPVGTPVLYWPGARVGEGVRSATRSVAWLLGDHTPVVMVEGYAGGVALTHVCPIPTPPLRVEIAQKDGEPTTCEVWRDDVLVFDGVDRSALLSVTPPKPKEDS